MEAYFFLKIKDKEIKTIMLLRNVKQNVSAADVLIKRKIMLAAYCAPIMQKNCFREVALMTGCHLV